MQNVKNLTKERKITIGTHNGIFHADEVVACSILQLVFPNSQVIRTRNMKILKSCDYVVDVGGGKFDHHIAGFDKKRENGVLYASAGLIFKEFGHLLINLVHKKYFSDESVESANIEMIFQTFDQSYIVPVDNEDNGLSQEKHEFSWISSFLPLWFEKDSEIFDYQFDLALKTSMSIIEQLMKHVIVLVESAETITSRWNDESTFKNGILEIPAQTFLWIEPVLNINALISSGVSKGDIINFVVFPYPDGGYAAQCVPPSDEQNFSQRIPFPKEWAGQTDKLPGISGVSGATFCHNGCFFAKAKTKEDVIQMCLIATKNSSPS